MTNSMDERNPDENGWQSSAAAWIKRTGDEGDFARAFVLDQPMLDRATSYQPQNALDVGCGEGRFCRKLAQHGIAVTGLDPVLAMVDEAQARHEPGTYVQGFAEDLPFPDASFDLVVSYLVLIDIDDAKTAIAEMARVLRPGGHILVANLSSFATSSATQGTRICRETGAALRPLGLYLRTDKQWYEWDGVRVQNWHRPLSFYMQCFLDAGLILTHFDEPQPHGGPENRLRDYQTMPFLMTMDWKMP